MKKTLVILLALVMVFAFATTAMAADTQYTPYPDIANQDPDIQTAIERLTILGALKGYNAEGTIFAPANLITREEFATIGVRIAGLEDQVALYASLASAFTDVEEGRWSEGYINCANASGIMIGRGGGKFDPKANVTMQEVTTVLLRAVGYDDRLPGAWPSDYNKKAVNVGLTEYVDYIGPKFATRGEVASLVNEAIDLRLVQYSDNEFATGIGMLIAWFNDDDLPIADADGFMYKTFKTNEDGNWYSNLLYETFGAYVAEGQFDDTCAAFSETSGWAYEDFAKGELYMNFRPDLSGDMTPGTWDEYCEVASLYGISDGADLTDLGYMQADLTILDTGKSCKGWEDNDEIAYVDFTSTVTRTSDAEKDYCDLWKAVQRGEEPFVLGQDKEKNNGPYCNTLCEGDCGEVWFDCDGKAYASKDFDDFACAPFGIVDRVNDKKITFKDKNNNIENISLSDDNVFYLMGTGFITADQLEENDVVYCDEDLETSETLNYQLDEVTVYLVFRPVLSTENGFTKQGADWVEIDDTTYNAFYCGERKTVNAFYSIDLGGTVLPYDLETVKTHDFSSQIYYTPAYAFCNFAYFFDSQILHKMGILDSYILDSCCSDRLREGQYVEQIRGINVLLCGDEEPTAFYFEDPYGYDAWDTRLPIEGSLIEFDINNDGEVVQDGTYTAIGHDWYREATVGNYGGDHPYPNVYAFLVCPHFHGAISADNVATWNSAQTKLTVEYLEYASYTTGSPSNTANDPTPRKDVFTFADNACIFLVDSIGADTPDYDYLYDIGSAQYLTLDEFKALGDFSSIDFCAYQLNGKSEIQTLYVRDLVKEAKYTYGIGMVTGSGYKADGKYYAQLDGKAIEVSKAVFNTLVKGQVVAYMLTDGIVENTGDCLPIDSEGTNSSGDLFAFYQAAPPTSNTDSWAAELELHAVAGDVAADWVDWFDGELVLNQDINSFVDPGNELGIAPDYTFYTEDYVNGWDQTVTPQASLKLKDLKDGDRVIVIFDDEDNALYVLRTWTTPPVTP